MNKTYLSLLLATNVMFVSCMERERRSSYDFNKNVPVFITQPNTLITSHTTHNPYTWQPPQFCEANQPGWQQLDNIMNMTYNNNQPTAIDEIELKPIYRPAPTNSAQKEQKPFLRTLTLIEPDKQLIDTIYTHAVDIDKDFTLKKFAPFIALMNSAKNKNIDADVMGKHAYNLWLLTPHISKEKPVFFFGYIKKYIQTVDKTNEPLPKYNDIFKKTSTNRTGNYLARALNLSSSVNVEKMHLAYDEYSATKNYPTFAALKRTLHDNYEKKSSNLLAYIYSENNTAQYDYLDLSYAELKNHFHDKSVKFYETGVDRENYIYDAIQIIEAGKALHHPKQEIDFGYDMISEQTTLEKLFSLANIDHANDTRKRIGMLCYLIQEYNKQRKAKKSPSIQQVNAYQEYCRLCPFYMSKLSNFAFPDSFDHKLFDEEIYAFEELNKLKDMINTLKYASDGNVQECIDQIYPPRK